MTCRTRREPWLLGLLRLAGMAAGLVAVGYGADGVGWLFAHVTDPLFGAVR